MAVRFRHGAGGPVSWLQGAAYTDLFSGVSAFTVDWSYKCNGHTGTSNVWLFSMITEAFFFSLDSRVSAGVSQQSPLVGVAGDLGDGLWHRAQMRLECGLSIKLLVDGNVVDEKPFPAALTNLDPMGLLWVGIRQQVDGWPDGLDYSIGEVNGYAGLVSVEDLGRVARGEASWMDVAPDQAKRFRYDFSGGESLVDRDGVLSVLVEHGAVEWDLEKYAWTNPCRLLAPVVQESGYQLEFSAVDAGGEPMLLWWAGAGKRETTPLVDKAGAKVYYLSHDGSPTGRPLYAIDGADGLVASWKLPWQVLPGEVVTVVIPEGVFLGSNGAPNVETTLVAENRAGMPRENFDGVIRPDHPRMGVVGSGQTYYVNEFYYANLLKNWDRWLEVEGDGWEEFVFDAVGNIVGIAGSTGTGLPYIRGGWDGKGLVGGIYTLLYTAGDPYLTGRGGTAEGGVGIAPLDSGMRNGVFRKRYVLDEGVEIEVHVRSLPTGSIELLDPFSVDASGFASVGMVHPKWKEKFDRGQCSAFRHLIAVNNTSGGFDYAAPDDWYGPWPGMVVQSDLLSFTQVEGSDIPPAYTGTSYSCFHVLAPHHSFVDGQLLAFFGTGGPPPGGLDGTPNSPIVVDGPDSFYVNWGVPAAPEDPSLSYWAEVVHQYNPDLTDPLACVSGFAAFDRVLEQCNACGHDYWFTYPVCWSDLEIAEHEKYVAARLKPGLHNYREWGNETHWNIGSTVFQFAWTRGLQAGFTGNPAALYAGQRGAQACLAGLNAWVVAGRKAQDFSRVLSGQAVDPLTTFRDCWGQAKAYWSHEGYSGEPFDVVTYAPYAGYELTPNVISGNQRLADWYVGGPAGVINPGAVLDVLEPCIEGPVVAGNMRKYRDLFAKTGLRTAFYEWGVNFALNEQTVESGMPQEDYPGGNAQILRALVAAQQHPRHNKSLVRLINLAAEVGCELACHLGSVGIPSKYGTCTQYWTMYQPSGPGEANIGHLFDTPPPEANSAYILRAISLTSEEEPPALRPQPLPVSAVFSQNRSPSATYGYSSRV